MSQSTAPQRRSIAVAQFIYCGLLHLYLRAFHQQLARKMVQVFSATCKDAQQRGGFWSPQAVVPLAVPDVVLTASKECLTLASLQGATSMAPIIWPRIGSSIALIALDANIGFIIAAFNGKSGLFIGTLLPEGVRLLGQIATLLVMVALMILQRANIGRILGGVAIAGNALYRGHTRT
jgi:hypothetical protein